MGVDIPSFCKAKYFYYEKASKQKGSQRKDCVSFMKPVEFHENKKYIMVSATANKKISQNYFGKDNVEFHECKNAQYKGTLNQYYDKTMSRACIDKNPIAIGRIKRWSGFEHTITFKKYHIGDLHFGNTEGCDYLKGENIDVIGTPHQLERIYKLFALSIGLDFDEDAKLNQCIVDHNGYRFRFMTYEDEDLRAVQFYMIESELEQAVGRARLLRKPCTVNLFSNFPLSQAQMIESDY
jgi:hypothetical protein